MEFNYQFDEYGYNFLPGRDYCLIGNGLLQVMVQFKSNFGLDNNAVLLNMLCADEYRPRRFWLLSHHAYKEIPSCVAIKSKDKFFICDSRQIGTPSLTYELKFEKGTPVVCIRYFPQAELKKDLKCTVAEEQRAEEVCLQPGSLSLPGTGLEESAVPPVVVNEKIWCPLDLPVVMREVTVNNAGQKDLTGLEIWNFLAPNKLFLPDAAFFAKEKVAVSGYWNKTRQFLGLGGIAENGRYVVAEFPGAFDAARNGAETGNQKVTNPFMGPHLAVGYAFKLLRPAEERKVRFFYVYGKSEKELLRTVRDLRSRDYESLAETTSRTWGGFNQIKTADANLDLLFNVAKAGIRAAVSKYEKPGRLNAGVWHYDAEWSRDSDFSAMAAVMNGQFNIASDILKYSLENLTDDRGYCSCGSGWEGEKLAYQIDTNGLRLYALWLYRVYTGDETILRNHWPKIKKIIGVFFEKERYSQKARMLIGTRDCWERWESCGLRPGFELFYQFWASIGLEKAAGISRWMGEEKEAKVYAKRARAIWDSVMHHPAYALISKNHFIKRRTLKGDVQLTACGYRGAKKGYLEPDSCELFPILFHKVGGETSLAVKTVQEMEKLWNQGGLWKVGGYTRYNITSDPESTSGPWPGITTIVARAALETHQYDIFRKSMKFLLDTGYPTYTFFEHHDYESPGKTDHRWYRGGVVPWLSYAELSMMFVHNMLGFLPDENTVTIKPNLPPEIKNFSASVKYKKFSIDINIVNQGTKCRKVLVDGTGWKSFDEKGAVFEPFTKSVRLDIFFGF